MSGARVEHNIALQILHIRGWEGPYLQIEGDIGVKNGGMYDQQDNQHPMPSQIGACKKINIPYAELVSLFQVVVVLQWGLEEWYHGLGCPCEKWWVPTVLFSSVAVRLAKTVMWVMCFCALQLWEFTDGDCIWLVDRKGILIRESRQLLDGLSLFECG